MPRRSRRISASSCLTLPIAEEIAAYRETLAPVFFVRCPSDVTEENIQSRIRGNLLMALSNKFGWLVLTTGNKSEYWSATRPSTATWRAASRS